MSHQFLRRLLLLIAVAANTEGRREIIGPGIGPSQAETFRTDFLRSLKARGLDGMKLVVSDAHTGLRAAIARVLEREAQSRSGGSATAERAAFIHAAETWHRVADQVRPRWPRLADLVDASEHDVSARMSFPRQHRTRLHGTNLIERLNREVERLADVVGIFPNEASILRLIGAVLFEQSHEWQTSSRYMMVKTFAQVDKEEIDPLLGIATKAA